MDSRAGQAQGKVTIVFLTALRQPRCLAGSFALRDLAGYVEKCRGPIRG